MKAVRPLPSGDSATRFFRGTASEEVLETHRRPSEPTLVPTVLPGVTERDTERLFNGGPRSVPLSRR